MWNAKDVADSVLSDKSALVINHSLFWTTGTNSVLNKF